MIDNVELRDYAVDHTSIDCDRYRRTVCAFAMLKPGELERFHPAAIRPEGCLFFAGERCSTDQGWIQCALVAA